MTVQQINSSDQLKKDSVWERILLETREQAEAEPSLASFLHATILNHESLEGALSFHLANKLANPAISALQIREIIEDAIIRQCSIAKAVRADIVAIYERDSACNLFSLPFLYFKGFHALQAHRVAHCLWNNDRKPLAYFLQSHISMVFGVDIASC